jgi:multiple sugar transport system ATP-binding protein
MVNFTGVPPANEAGRKEAETRGSLTLSTNNERRRSKARIGPGAVEIKDLVKTYVDDRGHPTFTAVKNINLQIEDGEFMVLVGPSGCGKSTTLRMIAGLERITSGTISIGGRVVNDLEPKDRGIAMVFQNYALYPHMNLFNNMAFGLQLAKKQKEFISETVGRTATALGLNHMLDRKPSALSGGQRQRVALGRAIVRSPKVFLFDEPLSNLDAKMRVQMRSEISKLHAQLRNTMIYVTHDQVEAMTMGDRICVLRDGAVMQVADPQTLYRQPENLFVAGFIGSPPMNLLKGKIKQRDGRLFVIEAEGKNALAFPLPERLERLSNGYLDKDIVFGIRPEHVTNERKKGGGAPVTLTVDITEPMGSESLVYLKTATANLVARIPGEHLFHSGEQLTVQLDLEKISLFDVETEKVIR